MNNRLLNTKEMQLARALSGQTIARVKIAAAILGITPKHLHALSKRPGFPQKVKIGSNADLEAWIQAHIVKGESQ